MTCLHPRLLWIKKWFHGAHRWLLSLWPSCYSLSNLLSCLGPWQCLDPWKRHEAGWSSFQKSLWKLSSTVNSVLPSILSSRVRARNVTYDRMLPQKGLLHPSHWRRKTRCHHSAWDANSLSCAQLSLLRRSEETPRACKVLEMAAAPESRSLASENHVEEHLMAQG